MAKTLEPYYLPRSSIAWAIKHLDKFGDTDIFPVPIEFQIVNKNSALAVEALSEKDLTKHQYLVPRRTAVPKSMGGFRVASQLSPIDAILFTGLAHHVSPNVEHARLSRSRQESCSFRLDLKENGQFFVPGFGFGDFNRATERHIRDPRTKFVLSVDLADFYNQISHHRIANNMESVGFDPSEFRTAEHILDRFSSNHHSRGLPIGPTASIIFAEIASLDIDSFIVGRGIKFCRYVDDFRFFFDSKEKALCFLSEFSEVLFTNHRLATNTTKTKLWSTESFNGEIIDEDLLEEEKQEAHLMAIIRSRSESCAPGDEEDTENASPEERNEATRNAIDELFSRVESAEPLPTGLAKFVLHRGRTLKTTKFTNRLLDNLDHFIPVVGDVVNYITSIDGKNRNGYLRRTYDWLTNESIIRDCAFMHEWAGFLSSRFCDSLWSNWEEYETAVSKIPKNVVDRSTPLAAARFRNWGYIRLLKERIDAYDESSRRAIVIASCVLSDDEKKHWLSRFDKSGDIILDSCVKFARSNTSIPA